MSQTKTPSLLHEGPWRGLLQHAFRLIDDFQARGGLSEPYWTFGGGTVLMLRYHHRKSKDIDIFVPDPQYLGYVTPRLSDLAMEVASDYVEAAGYVKLIRSEGEIDFVASPNLTQQPFEWWNLLGRDIRVETPAEIMAKKLWHRGDIVTGRDIFDLSLVIEKDPEALRSAATCLIRHREAFLEQMKERQSVLKMQFDAIDALDHRPVFEDACELASEFLRSL